MKKIKAFTLLEVTVAMLLSAICISICYTAFTLTNQYYTQIKLRKDEVGNVLQLKLALQHDFETATKMTRTELGFNCENANGHIDYQFAKAYILRNDNQLRTDTLKIEITDPIFKFETQEVADLGLIDELIFSYQLQKKKTNMSFQKIYSATDLFQ